MKKSKFTTIEVKNSSNISALRYKPEDKILEVHFLNGKKYRYTDVPELVFVKLTEGESTGKAFYQLIKGKYPYQEITNETTMEC